jgi:hypothetical protein
MVIPALKQASHLVEATKSLSLLRVQKSRRPLTDQDDKYVGTFVSFLSSFQLLRYFPILTDTLINPEE